MSAPLASAQVTARPEAPDPAGTAEGGIYVHFAYCARRCVYCDFALATPRRIPVTAYTDALIAELAALERAGMGLGGRARTLYVGGGTPSLWDPRELARFLDAVHRDVGLDPAAETTLEANPEDVTEDWLAAVLALGVNRISLGVQSLDAPTLASLSRAHGVSGATLAMTRLAEAHAQGRLRSFSVDLIYGHVGQTMAAWEAELDQMVARFAPPHLSLYALTVEPRTVLGLEVRRGKTAAPDDGIQGDMLFAARARLAPSGYTHYEVSSWARPGHVAVHNSAYWELRPWLGLGAGAHGFVAGQRTKNEPRPARYVEHLAAGTLAHVEVEVPDTATLAFERVLTGLRRLDLGVVLPAVDVQRFAVAIATSRARGWLTTDVLPQGEARLRLTDHGLRFMDDVLLAFVP